VTGTQELAAADAYCRLLAARHRENFAVASRLLPSGLRQELVRVYAYCRFTDDLADESGDRARERLWRWRGEVGALFAGAVPVHPVLVSLRATVQRHRLPARPFLDLVEAGLQDQEVRSYGTWAELDAHCQRSAAPVGRIVLSLFGLTGERVERLSDDVCVGLQLANFAQDVSVDRANGRCYLLRREVERLGVPGAVHVHCQRARQLLGSGEELEALAPTRLRLQLGLYRLGGLAILDAIGRAGFDTASLRPRLSAAARAALVPRAVALAAGRRGGYGAGPAAA
jgi:squalene synthase HpnC